MNKPFDPWTATTEEINSINNEGIFLFEQLDKLPRNHNYIKLIVWKDILLLQESDFHTGREILDAVKSCISAEITVPEWLFKEFSDRLSKVDQQGARWSDRDIWGEERSKLRNF